MRVVEDSKILREYPITPGRIEGHGRRGKPLTEHLNNIFATGELDEKPACRDFRHTAEDSEDCTTRSYNLDAINYSVFPNSFPILPNSEAGEHL